MPGFDKTGPMGHGPRSGRGLGPCGRGIGFGRGCEIGIGRGFRSRRGYGLRYAEPIELTKEEQKKILESELKELEAEKQEINRQLKKL